MGNVKACTTAASGSDGGFKCCSNRDPTVAYKAFGRKFVEKKINDIVYTLDERYKLERLLGKGSFGSAASGVDQLSNRKIAVKRVTNFFDNSYIAKRVLKEVSILRHLVKHPNVVSLVDFYLEPKRDFQVCYIIFELMETDLQRVLASKSKLIRAHHQFICYQILCALKFIHSAGVLHKDLKPVNVLLNADSSVRLCDFGGLNKSSGTGNGSANGGISELGAPTRWYRAPELMLCDRYDERVDIWGVGCILAEFHEREPVFRGRSSDSQ
eukprot:567952-Amorphochlora_amoeboformis.AAC.1